MNKRLPSLDIMRGIVMVLMAIDHVRVYSGIPAGGPNPAIFFTRWITHFCVPAFVFFAGTGAYLYGTKLGEQRSMTGDKTSRAGDKGALSESRPGDKGALARFLFLRGLLLVVLELTIIRFCWTFNLDYARFALAGVIWMLGWCMILMAALVRLPTRAIGIIGLAIIFGQQAFGWLGGLTPPNVQRLWDFFYPTATEPWPGLEILYTLIPWIGVMAAGYAFGMIMQRPPEARQKICLWIGLSATGLFIVIGGAIVLWHPAPPDAPSPILRLLNQTKYPASQLYLLMTLGPTIALLPWAERLHGRVANILLVFGRVPLFYYLLHILLIHGSALLVNYLRTGSTHQEWYATAPYDWIPEPQRWTLWLLYLTWFIDVVLLYFACRWYAAYKTAHPEKRLLKYL